MYTKNTLFFLLLISFHSCNYLTPVEFDTETEHTALVVNSLFTTDDSITLFVYKINQMTESGYTFLKDAKVKLFVNEYLIEEVDGDSSGMYKSSIIPKLNDQINIHVEYSEYDAAFAENKLPTKILLDSTKFTKDAGVTPWGMNHSATTLYFKDPPNESNYYEIIVYHRKISYIDTNEYVYFNDIFFPHTITDPLLVSSGCLVNNANFAYFTDELIDGQAYAMKIHLDIESYGEHTKPTLIVCLKSVSKELYEYHKTMADHLWHQSGLELEPFIIDAGNPINMYSNIDGGLGIFAGYQDDIVEIKLY